MDTRSVIDRLRSIAAMCQRLAHGASDREAAHALRNTAEEIEVVVPLVEARGLTLAR